MRRRHLSSTTVALGLLALAAPEFAEARSNAARFDIVCHVVGKVVADPHPDYTGTYPANVRKWRYELRDSVDLGAMTYCEYTLCTHAEWERIPSITPGKIIFGDTPSDTAIYFRRKYYWYSKLIDGEKISITRGPCRIAKLSNLPPTGLRPVR